MAITVQYGPVAAALGLANQAGQGLLKKAQAGQDDQFLQLVNSMQSRLDANHAQEISQSLQEQSLGQQADQDQARNQLIANQQAAQTAYQNAGLSVKKDSAATSAENAKAAEATRQQQADLQNTKYENQQDHLSNLPQDQQDIIGAQGHLPAAGGDDTRLLIQEYRRLDAAARQAQKDQAATAYDPNDLKKILSEQSPTNPKAIKGMEQAYDSAGQRAASIQQRLQQIDQQLNTKVTPTNSLTGTNQPAVSQPAIQQLIQQNQQPQAAQPQQSAPAPANQQPRILATERNPQDGKMWGYDANQGRWIPLE